eukprot:2570653-Karenia_brevis.AAC.1
MPAKTSFWRLDHHAPVHESNGALGGPHNGTRTGRVVGKSARRSPRPRRAPQGKAQEGLGLWAPRGRGPNRAVRPRSRRSE